MLLAVLVHEGQSLGEWRACYGGAVADESLEVLAVKGVFLRKGRQLSQSRLVVTLVVEFGDEILEHVVGNGVSDFLTFIVRK